MLACLPAAGILPTRMQAFVDGDEASIGDKRLGEWIEQSVPLGAGTNNIAELKAIQLALELILKRTTAVPTGKTRVCILSDSDYAIGMLTRNWVAKENVELVAGIKKDVEAVKSRGIELEIKYAPGHSKVPGNERADKLASAAAREAKRFMVISNTR